MKNILLTLLLVFLFISGALLVNQFIANYTDQPEVMVSTVLGFSSQEAIGYLSNTGLRWKIGGVVHRQTLPEGTVVSQSPEGGRLVRSGREVSLIISTKNSKIKMPNFIGRPLSQAEVVIKELGLRRGEKKEINTRDYDIGTIISQNPAPETEVEFETFVNLVVATGEAK